MSDKDPRTAGVLSGGYVLRDEPIAFNNDKPVTTLKVRNTGDRPVQVGSHFHFFEANKELEFDRRQALGKRLNITSTTAIRFEPGDEVSVELIPYGGERSLYGFNNLVDRSGDDLDNNPAAVEEILQYAIERGFKNRS